jgi:hypothetical protein
VRVLSEPPGRQRIEWSIIGLDALESRTQ